MRVRAQTLDWEALHALYSAALDLRSPRVTTSLSSACEKLLMIIGVRTESSLAPVTSAECPTRAIDKVAALQTGAARPSAPTCLPRSFFTLPDPDP